MADEVVVAEVRVLRVNGHYGAVCKLGDREIPTDADFSTLGALFAVLASQVAGALAQRQPGNSG